MKYFAGLLCIAVLFASCKNDKAKLVDQAYADSLMSHYAIPKLVLDNNAEMAFWKNRIDPKNPGQSAESRYAGTLVARFHEFGDIQDLKAAETVVKGIDKTYNGKMASAYASLAG